MENFEKVIIAFILGGVIAVTVLLIVLLFDTNNGTLTAIMNDWRSSYGKSESS